MLRLDREIALIDARLAEQIERIDHGEAGYVWDALVAAAAAMRKATARRDSVEMQDCLNEMMRLIDQGARDLGAWRDIYGLLEQRRRFVESETKRQFQLSTGITLDQVGVFFAALTAAIKEEVAPDALARIQTKFSELTETDHSLRLVS